VGLQSTCSKERPENIHVVEGGRGDGVEAARGREGAHVERGCAAARNGWQRALEEEGSQGQARTTRRRDHVDDFGGWRGARGRGGWTMQRLACEDLKCY
jgi:hypothetical protein